MNYQIELYPEGDNRMYGTLPVMPIIRESLEKQLGWNLDRAFINITVLNVPEDIILDGNPTVENLIPEFGYSYISVYIDNKIIYRHPHPLNDILTQPLQEKLRINYPHITSWKFRVDIPGMPMESAMRTTPSIKGSVLVSPLGLGRKPGFSIKRVAEKPAPEKSLADYNITPNDSEKRAMVKVVMPNELMEDLCYLRPLSDKVEEGGFLVGKLYKDRDTAYSHILEINVAPAAEYTGASFFHFTFTGDSFAGIKRRLTRERPEERILGWYHTHLFPATVEMGLTSIDLTLHFGTFTFPWQVAGLLNLDGRHRTLRFYVREGNTMVLCPYWGINERG